MTFYQWCAKSAAAIGNELFGYDRAPENDTVLANGTFPKMAEMLINGEADYLVYTDSTGVEITIDPCELDRDTETGTLIMTGVFGWAPWMDYGEWIYTPAGDAFFASYEPKLVTNGRSHTQTMIEDTEAITKLPGM